MNTSATIILDTRYKTKKGYPIKIRIFNKTYKDVPLNEYSELDHWNKNNVNKNHPDFRRLNYKITKRYTHLIEEVNYCNDNSLSLLDSVTAIKGGILENDEIEILILKQKLRKYEEISNTNLLEFIDIRINEKIIKGEVCNSYKDLKGILKDYLNSINKKDAGMNEITYEWLNKFILYKSINGCENGGIMTYLKNLRAIYKESQRRASLNVKKDNPFLGLIKQTTTKEVTPLEKKDLRKLVGFTPNKKVTKPTALKMKRNIALSLFQFYIGGHNYIDIAVLEWKNIKNNRVRFKRHKNRNKLNGGQLVDNFLCDEALKIIEFYGTKKDKRVFSFIPDPKNDYGRYKDNRNNINRSFKSISKHLELTNILKTNTPRYTFRSIAGEKLISTFIVELLQGHKPAKVTFTYQKKLSYSVLDKQHKKIIKL